MCASHAPPCMGVAHLGQDSLRPSPAVPLVGTWGTLSLVGQYQPPPWSFHLRGGSGRTVEHRSGLCPCFSPWLESAPSPCQSHSHTFTQTRSEQNFYTTPILQIPQIKNQKGSRVSPLLADPEQRALRQLPWSLSAPTPFEGYSGRSEDDQASLPPA